MQCFLARYICLSCCLLFGYLQAEWTTPVDISISGQNADAPQIAVDPAGNATAVWDRSNGSNLIIQASTMPFGGSWQPTPDDLSATGEDATLSEIAVDSAGNATAVWKRFDGSNYIIQASTKPFGGSWQATPDNLSASGENADFPQIAVDAAGNATVVWQRSNGSNTIIQAATKPFGGSWASPDNLSASGENADFPQIAVDPAGNATAVWQRFNGSNIIAQASTKPFGGSWQPTPDNLSASGENVNGAHIAVDPAGNATAVWPRSDGSNLILQASTKPFGGSWQPTPDNLSASGEDAALPQIAVDAAGNATVVWYRSNGSNTIIQASTKPFGGSWATPQDLSATGQNASEPQIAVDSSGDATVVWYRSNGSNTIIQASTKPFGGSWQPTPDNLSATGQNAVAPQVATDPTGDVTIVVWQRFDGTNEIIQAAQKITGPTVTGLSPNSGPANGGNAVTITGTNFTNVTAVMFGSSSASSFTVTSTTTIQAVAPAGTGTVDVQVTSSSGTSSITPQDQYTYISPPSSPSHFHGTLARRLHRTQKWLLQTFWKPSQSTDVAYYRVYKGSKLVDIISSNGKLHYKDHLRWKSSAKKYKIAAVDALNQESARKRLKIEKD